MAWGRGPGAPSLHALLLQIEDCSKPVAMAIHGTALGGSDYPFITPDRWLADFAKISIRDDVRPLIVKENAINLLQLNEKPA